MTIGAFQQQQQKVLMQNSRNYSTMNILPPSSYNQHHLISSDTKGLLNGPGQNNCFLNCAVQVSLFVSLFAFTKCSGWVALIGRRVKNFADKVRMDEKFSHVDEFEK